MSDRMLEENFGPRRRRPKRSRSPMAQLQKRFRRLVIEVGRSGLCSKERLFLLIPLVAMGVILYKLATRNTVGEAMWADDPGFLDDYRPNWLYLITVTREGPSQERRLARLSASLAGVERVRWLVVDDSVNGVPAVKAFLAAAHLPDAVHLHSPAEPWPYGQLNHALRWIRNKSPFATGEEQAMVAVLDEDMIYANAFFEGLKSLRRAKAAAWPIGLNRETRAMANLPWNLTTQVRIPFWYPRHISGFAVHTRLLKLHPHTAIVNYSPLDMKQRTEAKAVEKFMHNLLVQAKDIVILGASDDVGRKFDVTVWREPL